jgi:formate dehydrogenase subunit gamma
MSSASAERPHIDRAIVVARERDNVVVGGEIVRHRRATRIIHWTVALTFFIALLSGMPIWTPLFGWMAYLVGGLEVARVIHPYAGVAFVIASVFQFFHWLGDMMFSDREKGWWRPSKMATYLRWEDEPAWEGGKYNGGQKLFFWAVCLGALGFLISGIPMWFPTYFPALIREISILIHDITFIGFLVGVIFHIYLGTAAEPGTFRAMTRGTVSRSWARLHHPSWFRQVTGDKADDRSRRT